MEDKERVMSTILTPEQMEKYKALQAERKAHKHKHIDRSAPAEDIQDAPAVEEH